MFDVASRPDLIRIDPGRPLIGLAALTRMAFQRSSFAPVIHNLIERLQSDPKDASALLDASTIELLQGNRENRLSLQQTALSMRRYFTHMEPTSRIGAIRLLALAAPGDFMANTPLEFLLEGSGISLDVLYVTADGPLPDPLPDHDLVFVAVAESDDNQPILARIASKAPLWPRPLINHPQFIARLSRDGACGLLRDAPGLCVPLNRRVQRQSLVEIVAGTTSIDTILDGADFPIIARPIGSHAGNDLAKIDGRVDLARYLGAVTDLEFYIAPFVDYRNEDGLYRKYRVVLIDGAPFAVHMAVSKHWMIHYLNADMTHNARNRAEEALFMADFDLQFAVHHAEAFASIKDRTGLEYILIDCAESSNGNLLIFETGTAMIIHSLDPKSIFPYKALQMNKIFQAFVALLNRRSKTHCSREAWK